MPERHIEMTPRDDANDDRGSRERSERYKKLLAEQRKSLDNKPLPKPKPPEQPVMEGF